MSAWMLSSISESRIPLNLTINSSNVVCESDFCTAGKAHSRRSGESHLVGDRVHITSAAVTLDQRARAGWRGSFSFSSDIVISYIPADLGSQCDSPASDSL